MIGLARSGIALAAAAALLTPGMLEERIYRPAPAFPPNYPREGKRRKYYKPWDNQGVRANKQYRLKGVRP